ncbi:MAG TPA: hypothetical protein VJ917_10800 [Saprospiraceae bacterium]|nr:hypothetical protein [Saprospiraceae bacterium]
MKNFILILLTFLISAAVAEAQVRYLEPVFDEVTVQREEYGSNISIITGQPMETPLLMDVYQPVGDTETERPVIIVPHTGSFLPPIFNGTTSGDLGDSTLVEVCTRLAQRGYVAVGMTYRLGWQPEAADPNVRKGSLLQAVYRSVQDSRTCVRNLRRTVDEENNPFGIDQDRIGMFGIGSGGYVSFAAGCLDDYSEVLLDKFLDSQTNLPLIDTTILGNFDATEAGALCIPNHVGYDSDFDIAVNIGGALGDMSWIDGRENEPAYCGFHCLRDPFAPWFRGIVIVPTTRENVVEVSGTREAVQMANDRGNNTVLEGIPAAIDPIQPIVDVLSGIPVDYNGFQTTLATNNMYTFITPDLQGSPWDWWDLNVIRAKVAAINMQFGTNFDADLIHQNGLLTNADMSAQKARTYLDTVFAYATPRIYTALELSVNNDEIAETDVELKFGPNPATAFVNIEANEKIEKLQVFDARGLLVKSQEINQHQFRLPLLDLQRNQIYFVRMEFGSGYLIKQLSLH